MKNNEFLEGFVEECCRRGVPEEAIPGLYKQAVAQIHLMVHDEDFIAGYKSELTKSAMTGEEVDAFIEKQAAPWGKLLAGGIGAGILAGIPLGHEWRSGMFVPARERMWQLGHSPEETAQIYQQGGGVEGMSAKKRMLQAMGGDPMSLLSNPGAMDEHMNEVMRGERMNAENTGIQQGIRRMRAGHAAGGGMPMLGNMPGMPTYGGMPGMGMYPGMMPRYY